MEEFGLLKVIHPDLELGDDTMDLITSLHNTLLWFDMLFTDEHPNKPLLYITALLAGLDEKQREEAAHRLDLPEGIWKASARARQASREALRLLPARDRAATYEIFSRMSLEAVLLSMAATTRDDKKKEISEYLMELRKVKPILNGNDLLKLGIEPGLRCGEVLRTLRHERLRGNIASREDEERFVRDLSA